MDDNELDDLLDDLEDQTCFCGHDEWLHKLPFQQASRTGKSFWTRYCRGHRGYATGSGEIPCRCQGFEPRYSEDKPIPFLLVVSA